MKRFLLTIIAAVFTLSLVAAFIAFRSSPTRAGFQKGVEITNQTISLQIVSTKVDDQNVIVEVKNVGTKSIVSYEIAYEHGGSGESSGFYHEAWKPGDVSEIKIPLKAFDQGDVLRFSLTNCTFEDLSSEGDWKSSQRNREMIEGQWRAYSAGRKHLSRLMTQQNGIRRSDLRDVSEEIKQIPEPDGLTEFQKGGFREGLEMLQILLQAGENNVDAARDQEQLDQSQAKRLKQVFSRVVRMSKTVEQIQSQKEIER